MIVIDANDKENSMTKFWNKTRDFSCPALTLPCEYIVVDSWKEDHVGEIPWSCLQAMGKTRTDHGAIFFSTSEIPKIHAHKHYVSMVGEPKEQISCAPIDWGVPPTTKTIS
jgi:hypothetical protein